MRKEAILVVYIFGRHKWHWVWGGGAMFTRLCIATTPGMSNVGVTYSLEKRAALYLGEICTSCNSCSQQCAT